MTRVPDYPSPGIAGGAAVDHYFNGLLCAPDDILTVTLADNAAAGLPAHDVSPAQGKLLALFVRMTRARHVFEIGTLGGYSTIWMARALTAGGRLVTIEANEHHAAIARRNIARAGLADHVELHIGRALDILPRLDMPFDLIFIDADKPNNPDYLKWALRLSRPGTVIIADNIVRGGAVIDEHSSDPNVIGVRASLQMMADEPRLSATAIQTVGEKGWDGFALAVVGEFTD